MERTFAGPEVPSAAEDQRHEIALGANEPAPGADVIQVYDDQPLPDRPPGLQPPELILIGAGVTVTALLPLVLKDRHSASDILSFLCFVPAMCLFYWGHAYQNVVAPVSQFFGKFAFGWLVLLPTAILASLVLFLFSIMTLAIIFAFAGAPPGSGLLIAFVLACSITFSEEVLKLLVATRRDTYSSVENPKQYVLFSLYTALGLATAEGYFLSLLIREVFNAVDVVDERSTGHSHWNATGTDPASADQSSDGPVKGVAFVALIFICCLVIIPMHLLSGYHIGLGVARRDVLKQSLTTFRIVIFPFLFRVAFLFCSVVLLPMTGAFSLLPAFAIEATYVIFVKRAERAMPRDYLSRTGYLSAFGYGVIGSSGDDEAAGEQATELPQQPPPPPAPK